MIRSEHCIFYRPGMRSGSSVILSALAVADTLTLLIGPTTMYFNKVYDIDIERQYLTMCKTNRYFKSVFSYVANWLIIIFTIFRVIAVYWPHKVNIYCTRRRAYVAVFLTCLLSVIGNLDSLIFMEHIPKYNKAGEFLFNRCWFKGSRHIYYTVYSRWVLLITMSIIPFIILISGNLMIIFKIIRYKIKRRLMSVETNNSTDAESMTAILISISLLFLATQVPAIVVGMFKRKIQDASRSEEFLHSFYLIDGICKLLKWVNHAVNFFCYCIAGRRFREELVSVVMRCFRKRKLPKSSLNLGETTTATSVSNNI